MTGSTVHLFRLWGALCLVLLPVMGSAQDEVEVPAGYEDAPVAGSPAAANEGEAAAQPQMQVLVDAVFDADPNVANMEKQYLPRFQSLWKAEIAFVQRVCRPDQAQREKIEAAKDRCTAAAAREYTIAYSGVRAVADPFGGVIANRAVDPRELIRKQMARLVADGLGSEKLAAYQDECERRDAHRKHAAVLNLVARLDEELLLSAEQRDKLMESLRSHYQDGWGQSLTVLLNNRQYLPSIPDQYVVSILNETQRAVWQGAQKYNMVGSVDFGNPVVILEDNEN
ncbi:MAG: hypothetical protein JJ992_15970 [Planctomycetes bacterium]|nr:hypothetical protein [Planctomycetota bacterium]